MPVDRPTFSESWYRVAHLKPRLRSTVQVHRQQYRGRLWHVLQDPSSNQFFRLNEPAYYFVGLLNGRRTIDEAWRIANEELGDDAPTQGEAIQILGQLYVYNLMHADISPDAESLFKRYKKRKQREMQGYLSSFLFARIPLFDPNNLLDTFLPAVGWLFSWIGFVLWAVMLSIGGYFVITHAEELAEPASGILAPDNLFLLYLSFALVKVIHEFGHAFACKRFGRRQGSGGEVHTMGIMFLVFTPVPYVDASSAWALKSKWERIVVSAGGMMIELFIAAIAAVIWANSTPGETLRALSYNVMFVASVSTLLFNGNPLLRYDSYYILSDLVEMPNLAQRSRQYIQYFVKKYVWRVKKAQNPAHSLAEAGFFVLYGVASTVYRVFISIAILMFVASKFFFIGIALAVAGAGVFILIPVGKFFKYLLTSPELARTRLWAMASSALTIGAVIWAIGLLPAPDRHRVEGVVEPVDLAFVFAGENGFVEDIAPSGREVDKSTVLARSYNRELQVQVKQIRAELKELHSKRALARSERKLSDIETFDQQIGAKREQLAFFQDRLNRLEVTAPISGVWISPDSEDYLGTYLTSGNRVGMVANLQRVRIRAVAGQDSAAVLVRELRATSDPVAEDIRAVEIRVRNRPDLELTGRIETILPAGTRNLPSAALGYSVGGSLATDPNDPSKAAEQVFEVWVLPDPESAVRLLSGQRVVVRISVNEKPLAVQWMRKLHQMFLQRLKLG
jgi:putative peptide zinc metalloprotease protein